MEEVDGKGQEGTGRSRKGETSQRGCAMDGMEMVMMRDSELEPMRCEMTSSVKECALRARSTHGVHHAIVDIVIGVVLGEVLVARVVPLVVDAVIGLTLGLIAHVVIVVFVVATF